MFSSQMMHIGTETVFRGNSKLKRDSETTSEIHQSFFHNFFRKCFEIWKPSEKQKARQHIINQKKKVSGTMASAHWVNKAAKMEQDAHQAS